jgi:hypothetical protein
MVDKNESVSTHSYLYHATLSTGSPIARKHKISRNCNYILCAALLHTYVCGGLDLCDAGDPHMDFICKMDRFKEKIALVRILVGSQILKIASDFL